MGFPCCLIMATVGPNPRNRCNPVGGRNPARSKSAHRTAPLRADLGRGEWQGRACSGMRRTQGSVAEAARRKRKLDQMREVPLVHPTCDFRLAARHRTTRPNDDRPGEDPDAVARRFLGSALRAPLRVGRRRCETLRAPCSGLAYAQVERTVRIKDSAPERHGLFRCGAFGAACVAVHRSNIREWHPPRPE